MNDSSRIDLPTFTIVVPSLNQGEYLGEALESIFRQGYPHADVVVMDGGSTDGSLAVVASFESKLKHWESAPDLGQADAINRGLLHGTGDLVAWLNADDAYLDGALWIVAEAYRSYPGFGLYVGNGFRWNPDAGRLEAFCPRHIAVQRAALAEGLDYLLQPSTFVLRQAWHQVGGLRADLTYGLDWDLFLRVADRFPALAVNEFLAKSREHGRSKTARGRMERALELARLASERTGKQATLGSAYYLLESMLDLSGNDLPSRLRQPAYDGLLALQQTMKARWGAADPFPVEGDRGDSVYVPIPRLAGSAKADRAPGWPSISVVVPSFNQASFLGRCLDSVLNQDYPTSEILVFDAGSTDGSVDILRSYGERIRWVSEQDRGPAHAVNKGLRMASGDVLGWLNSDDMLSEGALRRAAEAFAEESERNVVYGNALYVDEWDRLALADHGEFKTGLYRGRQHPMGEAAYFWTYAHAIPQPTVFFRRAVLEDAGFLDESYQFIFDFEFFWRLARRHAFHKLERIQAFYRLHPHSKTSEWGSFLKELYRFSRPKWPAVWQADYLRVLRSYLSNFTWRWFGGRRRHLAFWITAGITALVVTLRLGNPEAVLARRSPARHVEAESSPPLPETPARPEVHYSLSREPKPYRAAFCSFLWPRHPGHSGGEIRDFHLLRALMKESEVDFIALAPDEAHGRQDDLRRFAASVSDPTSLAEDDPDLVCWWGLRLPLRSRILARLREAGVPVLGPRYHADISTFSPKAFAFAYLPLREVLRKRAPNFLVVSPQLNPVALQLSSVPPLTRLILATYDVESVRMAKLAEEHRGVRLWAARLEARRAERFERDNLSLYDGVIAVSELDRSIFVDKYGLEPERVLVVENGVDTEYFGFRPRLELDPPNVVFVASMAYRPNELGALRLVRDVMPRVREAVPNARLWLVGGGPSATLRKEHDGHSTIVTGRVEDVRPYLDMAAVACMPLSSGSGTKYKVLEALSAGVPVVCTNLTLDGLDGIVPGRHVLASDDVQGLAQGVIAWLQGQTPTGLSVEGARRVVEAQYAWERNLEKLAPWLRSLADLPARGRRTG